MSRVGHNGQWQQMAVTKYEMCLCRVCRARRQEMRRLIDETYARQTAAIVRSLDDIDFEFGPSIGSWAGE